MQNYIIACENALGNFDELNSWHAEEVETNIANQQADNIVAHEKACVEFDNIKVNRETVVKAIDNNQKTDCAITLRGREKRRESNY